ncbi:TetR/AcrR family transcriptional regulator [Nocardiopsis halotolerans]|uniref:TetR/AcrR family transcriptional regulator n=1 Tax=Nocardiopsis halotolerans TaxID=124252 RepID=UPI00034AB335|nr:TetR/AcrR family transcriptional regulator [Nocardiopsis halotolerans]
MTEPERTQPRMTKGERTRRRIIDSASELFAKSGYLAVSLRDIAAHAGLTHAGVLHHFPNKEAMLLRVLSRRDEVNAPLVLGPDVDPRTLVDNLVAIIERNTGTPGLVALYAKLSVEATDPEHPAHTYFQGRYRILRERLTEAFTVLLADRPGPSPALAAQQLLALMDGLQTQWLLDPGAVDMRAAIVSFVHTLGLTGPEHPEPEHPGPADQP